MTPMSDNASSAPTQSERDHSLMLLRQMVLIRRFEEKCAEVYRAGKIHGFVHSTSAKRRLQSAPCRRCSPTTRSWTYRSMGMRWCAASRPPL